MTIKESLLTNGIRLTNYDKWLVRIDVNTYQVYQRKGFGKHTKVLYIGLDEEEAVRILMKD